MHGTAALPGHRRAVVLALVALALVATTGQATTTRSGHPRAVTVLVSATGAAVEEAVAGLGGRVVRRLQVIDGFSARLPEAALPRLRSLPGVRWAVPDSRVHLQEQLGQDSGAASAVYTDVIRAGRTWSTGQVGAGVGVAVIDTGIDQTGDLAGRVAHSVDFTAEGDGADRYGHGTFVGGLIAGSGAGSGGDVRGVAPGAQLVSLKIAGADGRTDVTLVLEALEWVLTHRSLYDLRVVNLSLGFETAQPYLVDPLTFALERVWTAGIVVVTATGNGGAGTVTSPGTHPRLLAVGASDDRTTVSLADDRVAPFSGSGAPSGSARPDVVAPGRSVVSSRSPGSTADLANPASRIGTAYARASGTSFSTAIVSGVAALVLGRHPSLTPDEVKQRIVGTARRLGAEASSARGGAGSVDAYGATWSTLSLGGTVSGVTGALVGAPPEPGPAVGEGSLQATRGSACLSGTDGACLSDDDADALIGFDPDEYFADDWAGSQWTGSQWTGSQWTGSAWVSAGSQWT